MSDESVLRDVLDAWKSAVDAHDPDRVATLFTADAIFQGVHPYGVGPAAVAAYYAPQPIGLTAAYDLRETRHLSDDLILGYAAVEFTFTERPPVRGFLGVLVRRAGDTWRIAHYQFSRPA
ncbi:SgcJ/EcaC family oxidoreductase [Dactylosporangium sp. NPDC050588]|uniref:YybH family protein n=1 Tax=Dactylosporangium sp. NPDC050588 TaxID=3157211 RepID=UPI0033DDE5C4